MGRLCLESNPDVAYGVELQSVSPTSSELPSLSLGAHTPRMNRPHTATSRFGRRTVSRCSHPRSHAYSLSPLEARAPFRCASHYFQVWPSNVVSELLSHVIEFLLVSLPVAAPTSRFGRRTASRCSRPTSSESSACVLVAQVGCHSTLPR